MSKRRPAARAGGGGREEGDRAREDVQGVAEPIPGASTTMAAPTVQPVGATARTASATTAIRLLPPAAGAPATG